MNELYKLMSSMCIRVTAYHAGKEKQLAKETRNDWSILVLLGREPSNFDLSKWVCLKIWYMNIYIYYIIMVYQKIPCFNGKIMRNPWDLSRPTLSIWTRTGEFCDAFCRGDLAGSMSDPFWVNYNTSLTWIKAIWGWCPLLTKIPVRENSEVVIIYPDPLE